MYTLNSKDIANFFSCCTSVKSENDRIKILLTDSPKLEKIMFFHKMTVTAHKVDPEKLKKYFSTPVDCHCVYFQKSSLPQLGFNACKHTWVEYLSNYVFFQDSTLATNELNSIVEYLKFLAKHYNDAGLTEYSKSIISTLHVILSKDYFRKSENV